MRLMARGKDISTNQHVTILSLGYAHVPKAHDYSIFESGTQIKLKARSTLNFNKMIEKHIQVQNGHDLFLVQEVYDKSKSAPSIHLGTTAVQIIIASISC